MKNNIKLVVKIMIVIGIVWNLPFQKVYSEKVENVASTFTSSNTQTKSQSNGRSIYIYNTHQGEKYATNSVKEGSRYLMQLLQQRGYEVNYETTDFELYKTKNHIDYQNSYSVSKKYLNSSLKEHGGYDMVIDFHRDSVRKSLATTSYDGKDYAKLMFVVGKGSANYAQVNKTAKKLTTLLNSKIDGICRDICLKQSHYNQGTTKNMLLIEVGADENTYEEIKNSLNILSLVIDEYLSA